MQLADFGLQNRLALLNLQRRVLRLLLFAFECLLDDAGLLVDILDDLDHSEVDLLFHFLAVYVDVTVQHL